MIIKIRQKQTQVFLNKKCLNLCDSLLKSDKIVLSASTSSSQKSLCDNAFSHPNKNIKRKKLLWKSNKEKE